jgi:hypothetical protein
MVVNFIAHKISRDTPKLTRTSMLIKKKKLSTDFCQIDEFLEFVISWVVWFVVFWGSCPFCDWK